jgi:hypothetical protein
VALTLNNEGPSPRLNFLTKVVPFVLASCLQAACDDTNGRIKNVYDTGGDTADTAYVIDTDDTADTGDTGDTGELICPDRGQKFYVWQLGGIYDYPDSLREVAGLTGMTHGIISTSPEYIEWLLDNFSEAGLKYTPQLVKRTDCIDEDGNLDLVVWESLMRAYEGMDLQCYIDDGTFDGVLLLDDLGEFTDEGPDLETLDYMAGVAKEVLNISDDQDFPIILRHDPDDLQVNGYVPTDLDTIYSQMSRVKAEDGLATWHDEQMGIADELGLEMVAGVNLLDWEYAGDGVCPSGYDGFREGRCVISPEDLEEATWVISGGGCNAGVGGWRMSTSEPLYDYSGYPEALQFLVTAAD